MLDGRYKSKALPYQLSENSHHYNDHVLPTTEILLQQAKAVHNLCTASVVLLTK